MRWLMPLLLASCVSINQDPIVPDTDVDTPSVDTPTVDTPAIDTVETTDTGPVPLPWTDDPCAAIPDHSAVFATDVARFTAQDDAHPPPQGQLAVVGSSSIRRWESAFRELAPWGVVQRGVGGAHMADIAAEADALVLRHHPSGVLVFAGTNDVAFGVPPEDVVTAWRCLVQRVHDAQGPVPVVYVGITPTPSRWAFEANNEAVNAEIKRLADLHPKLWYVDIPAPFLATGGPPDAALFVDDGLHLSAQGYALWTSTILPVLDDAVPRRAAPTPASVASASYLRVDFGPSNADDGRSATVDRFAIHWNAWHPMQGGAGAIAGEALRGLVTTTGATTGIDMVLTGGFRANGLRNGGLLTPEYDRLGTMAVPDATSDFFYIEDPDDPGGFAFTGLDPASTYVLRLFASRSIDSRRVTRYVVEGAGLSTPGDLVTSGVDIGANGWDGNDSTVLTLSNLRPDAWGQLYVDVQKGEGGFGYVSLLELEVQ